MKISIQAKLLVLCLLLVLLTTATISATYYVLTKQDKQRESRQRIRIAFDIILDDFATRLTSYTQRFDEFLKEELVLHKATYAYSEDTSRIRENSFIITDLSKVTEEDDNTDLSGELACAGGFCEIV